MVKTLWKSPYILLIIATCFWGGNFVVGKTLVTEVPPFLLALMRWILALLVILPFWGAECWRYRKQIMRKWRMTLFLSLTGIAGFNTLTYIAVQYTGSINASLMNAATPMMIVVISLFMLKERINWSVLPAILLSLFGVIWIISRGSWSAIAGLSFNRGDLWMLAAIGCWALYSVGMKKFAGELPVHALFVATLVMALIVLVPSSVAEWMIRGSEIEWTAGLVSGVVFIGIFPSLLSFTAWNAAIAMIGPSRCSGFLNLIPLFSAIFAKFFAGESIRAYHLIGAVLIITGVYFMNRRLKPSSKRMEITA
ncbi:DMT family transporter [Paenibacillus naphthalenovorans]|uniref:DMT family transporter n=1 Tax=Paenibacillus naphthalenovorans TaxID=162209 RepID=UPI000884F34C|nr:DMT family transporter [Paenibacillus naphthalenovorans]SDJ24841.1 Permease of the drug/metabolite transporter (DMT) superfamily [Paenibacillus naphthalenovorans]